MGGEYLVWEGKGNLRGFRDFRDFRGIDLDDFFEHLKESLCALPSELFLS